MATVRRWLWCTHTPHIENQQSNISGSFIFATFFIISLSMVVARAATNARSICAMRVCAQHSYRRPASIRAYWIWVNGTTLGSRRNSFSVNSFSGKNNLQRMIRDWRVCVAWRSRNSNRVSTMNCFIHFICISSFGQRLENLWQIIGACIRDNNGSSKNNDRFCMPPQCRIMAENDRAKKKINKQSINENWIQMEWIREIIDFFFALRAQWI